MSRNAAVQYLLLFSALSMTLVIRWTWSLVASFCLKPNWLSGIIRFACSVGLILVRKIFSNNFDGIGSKLVGL